MLKLFFENINIYYSIYVYSDRRDISTLKHELDTEDYPYCILSNFDDLCIKELHYRLFLINSKNFEKYLESKYNSIEEITVIFIESPVYDYTCDILKNKQTTTHSMYLVEI